SLATGALAFGQPSLAQGDEMLDDRLTCDGQLTGEGGGGHARTLGQGLQHPPARRVGQRGEDRAGVIVGDRAHTAPAASRGPGARGPVRASPAPTASTTRTGSST